MLKQLVRTLRNEPYSEGTNSTTISPARWFLDFLRGGAESDSGVVVNGKTALSFAPVWQAVNCIAGDMGQLPLVTYQETADGRERARNHAAYRLLRRRPNRMMNACTFKETLQQHVLMWGNGRAGIVRDSRGRPTQLVPFLPDRSYEKIVDGKLWHLTRLGDSQEEKAFADEHVLHIKGLGFDGISGYSVISMARNNWGLGMAQEKHGNRALKNVAQPGTILETDATFSEPDALKLLADWEAMQAGLDNTLRTALLQRGVKAKTLSMPLKDAEWIEGRKLSRLEAAGWFNLPPHKLGVGDRNGYRGIEHEQQTYLNMSLMRWLIAWQEECDEKLLTEAEKLAESHYCEFNTAALLRGDLLNRYRAYQIGIVNEWLSPDEVRQRENMNKRPDGKGGVYRNPNTRSDRATKPAAPPADNRRELIVARLEEVIRVEQQRVTTMAHSPNTFLQRVNEFYSRWPATLARVLEQCGCKHAAADATEYCRQAQDELIDLAGRCGAGDIANTVQAAAAAWSHRAESMADQILGA